MPEVITLLLLKEVYYWMCCFCNMLPPHCRGVWCLSCGGGKNKTKQTKKWRPQTMKKMEMRQAHCYKYRSLPVNREAWLCGHQCSCDFPTGIPPSYTYTNTPLRLGTAHSSLCFRHLSPTAGWLKRLLNKLCPLRKDCLPFKSVCVSLCTKWCGRQ